MMNKIIRVGGVPEHFNLAWHLAIESGAFAARGYEIQWTDVPGGSGAMCHMLREGQLDIAITLTEGIVADIMNGNPSKLVQFYVNSPLRWGIYTGSGNTISTLKETEGKKYAISRFGSGSHLMAFVNARNLNFRIDPNRDFVLVGNLEGARKALASGEADVFMWEKFMTKPLVDAGEFKLLGECYTPWPCFAMVAAETFIENHEPWLQEVMDIINASCYSLKFSEADAVSMVAWRYQLKLEDVKQWFSELEYAYTEELDEMQMISIFNDLKSLGIIKRIPSISEICYEQNLQTV